MFCIRVPWVCLVYFMLCKEEGYLFVLCVACSTEFVNCLVKQFAIFLGVDVIVVECYGSVKCVGVLLNIPCMVFHIMCV